MANPKMRLLKGAAVLAKLWREGKRCGSRGWAPACACTGKQKTDFCGAKLLWASLAVQDAREVAEESEWGVLLAMTAKELQTLTATGLMFVIEHPDHGKIRIGRKGEVDIPDFVQLTKAPEGLDGFLKILKVFPKAKVVRVQDDASKVTV